MRCPDCNKFASFDADTEPELESRVDDEGVVNVTARIVNTCLECGTELTDATFDLEIDLSSEIVPHLDKCADGKKGGLTVDVSAERTERYEEKDRHGRPIKLARYRKHYYGVEVEAIVTCGCGEEFKGTDDDEMTAGSMETLV